MSTLNFYLKLYGYSDEDVVTPQEQDFNWTRDIKDISTTLQGDMTYTLSGSGDTTIPLPTTAINFLYIEVDGTVYLKLNGDTGITQVISPSEAGERDGLYFKRGSVTSIVITVPGADDVSAKIIMGV